MAPPLSYRVDPEGCTPIAGFPGAFATADRMQVRFGPWVQGITDSFAAEDPVLPEGEWGFDVESGVKKQGDGVTPWSGLPSYGRGPWSDLPIVKTAGSRFLVS